MNLPTPSAGRVTLVTLSVLPIVASPAGAQAHVHGMDDMMGWWMWGAGIAGVLFWLAVFALLVVVVWRLVRGGGGTDGGEDSAVRILRERYASGEIDQEEFERRRRDLEGR